jgi:cyclase
MLKKRIIFALLYKDGKYCLSRNFRLQEVGDVDWLIKNFNFEDISNYIDELFIINVGSANFSKIEFFNDIEKITKQFFIPITLGGQINSIDYAKELFSTGADKISLNTAYLENEKLALDLAQRFGSQAIVASIDFRKMLVNGEKYFRCYSKNTSAINLNLFDHIETVQALGCGEILLRSFDSDGSSNGLDMDFLSAVSLKSSTVPLIIAGGIGKSEHLIEGLVNPKINAVCTSNLLNFINDGFKVARQEVELLGLPVSKIVT